MRVVNAGEVWMIHLQQIQTVSTVKLERRLGALTDDEMNRVLEALARRLDM